jgi:hypothetical protein
MRCCASPFAADALSPNEITKAGPAKPQQQLVDLAAHPTL